MSKMKKIYSILLLLAVTVLTACSDDIGIRSSQRKPGELYFTFKTNNWTENGSRITRVCAPAEITTSALLDEPLYLHCEVTEGINVATPQDDEKSGSTRGQRYVGPVFNAGSYGVPSFGIYAKVGDHVALPATTVLTRDWFDEGTDGGSGVSEWRVKDSQVIQDYWGEDDLGHFYGYVPAPSEAPASGVSINVSGTVPTLTYTMPTNEANQMDIMTAKDEGISGSGITKAEKNENGVQLAFSHVLAAIRFKVKSGNNLTCRVNNKTYYVQLKSITINDVYNQGTCPILTELGTNHLALWSLESTKGTCSTTITRSRAEILADADRLITPDENCFMLLPQIIPDGVKATFMCDLSSDEGGSTIVHSNVTFEAPLYGTDGDNASGKKEWWPSYTYTYSISDDAVDYVFDYNTLTDKTYSNVVFAGTSEEGVFIRSYKMNTKGVKSNVDWEIQYYEVDADATGVGGSHGGDVGSWKTGTNGWIHVYDKTGGTYATANEVTNTHNGANENNTDEEKLFKIEVGSIMTPVIDLSLWNQDQTKRWRGRSTSNCYIVAGPGTYRIPLIYGNAWTNGSHNTSAYKATTSGTYMLSTFHNCNDVPIQSPFINIDLAQQVDHACLIWEEGDCATNGTVTYDHRSNSGGTSSGTPESGDERFGDKSNIGTVVKVVWDIDESITGEDDYNTKNGDYKEKANYLKFEIDPDNFNYGNAVVGICDAANNILWSWHIWITDPATFLSGQQLTIDSHDVTFAGTNIGRVEGGQSIAAQTREGHVKLVQRESGKEITINATQQKRRAFTTYFTNVLYQFGRKDPMRGNVDPSDMSTNRGAPRGTAGVVPWYNNYGNTATIGTLIKNPNSIYGVSNGDLYPSSAIASSNKSYCNLWATNLTSTYQSMWGTWQFNGKTIYDPSPVGYCVPPSRYLITLSNVLGGYASGFEEKTNADNPPFFCNYTYGGKTVKFYADGTRSTSVGYGLTARGYKLPEAALAGGACLGCFHTSTPYSRDESYQLHLYFYGGALLNDEVDTHTKELNDHAEALSVMPVLWNGEAVETQD